MTSFRTWLPVVRTGLGTAAVVSALVLAGCTSSDDDEGAAPAPEPEETVSLDSPSERDPNGEAEAAEPTSPPTTAGPGTSTPGTSTPGTATPGTATPGTATPGTSTPGTSTPGTDDTPGGDGTPPPTTAAPTPGPGGTASPRAAAAPARSVTVTSPADGAKVSGPVVFEVDVSGFTLTELTGQMSEDEGHLYAFVDEEPPSERVRLPVSESIVTSADSSIELGELEPGKHTVTVLATHAYPVPFEPRVHDTVTFTVRD